MAIWFARSRTVAQFLKTKIIGPLHVPSNSLFHANASCKTKTGYSSRKPSESWDKSTAAVLVFRRFEAARAGDQLEAVPYADDDQNKDMDFPGGRVPFTPQMKFISRSPDERIPCYRVLDDDGYLVAGSRFEEVDKERALKMYKSMWTLQIMDNIFYEAQRQGRISFYLTCTGEEAINIASAAAIAPDDIVLTQYREQGVLLWRGFTVEEFAKQCFGSKDGHGKGRQMPIHYGSKQLNFFTVSSPMSTQLPQAVGVAYSLKMDNKEACAVAFTGDGGTSEGDFHAALNFAAVMEAPVLFICRNNGWAISTPVSEQFRSDGVAVKGQAYGISSIRVDGNDTLAVYSAIRAAREMVMREKKPILVEALTYRAGPHSTSRPVNEIEIWRTARDPLTRFRKWIQRNGWWTDNEETELRGSIRKQVLAALQVAEKAEKSSIEELFTDVYDHLPSNLREQEKWLRETIKRHPQDFPTDVPV